MHAQAPNTLSRFRTLPSSPSLTLASPSFVPVACWYWGPYMWTNAWLVLYTWLQHTDPSVPQYGEDEWTWVKGAIR